MQHAAPNWRESFAIRCSPSARQWCGSKGLQQAALDKAKADDQRDAGEHQHHQLHCVKRLASSSDKLFMTRPPKTVPCDFDPNGCDSRERGLIYPDLLAAER